MTKWQDRAKRKQLERRIEADQISLLEDSLTQEEQDALLDRLDVSFRQWNAMTAPGSERQDRRYRWEASHPWHVILLGALVMAFLGGIDALLKHGALLAPDR